MTTDPPGRRLRGYPLLCAGLLAVLVCVFVIVEALEIPLLTDPTPWLREAGVAAGAIGVGLLVVDVLLPVPSSVVMVAQGALFGIAWGTLLSVVGGLGATLVAFLVGMRSRALVARLVPVSQQRAAERILGRYGALAIVLTRPVPILAEATAVMAGTTRLRWWWAALAGAAGNLPPALLYAVSGALAASLTNQALVLGGVVAVAVLFGLAALRSAKREAGSGDTGPAGVDGGR
jgi:uncharacterized membrane protein YdjX (TVP38/TMEM64 family)